MADNIIKRLIQLVMDKDSAKKAQSEVNQLTGAIDTSFKNLGKKIASYLAVGVIVNALKNLGAVAVAEAAEADRVWRKLKGTVDNTGASFDAMEEKIRATGAAFEDATVHDGEAFAESLDRLVTLTGDVSASLNNMGLVANVAAQFFEGELGPASDLVAKAMNGNINALKKMGIQAEDAQQALEILASRSFGAAEREAASFSGQMKQLDNTWKNILETIGDAIISSDGATDAFSVLRAALQVLGQWVADNKKEISLWVTNGVRFAIDATDVLIRTVMTLANFLKGGLQGAAGAATLAIGGLVSAWAKLREIEDDVRERLGQDVSDRRKLTTSIRENAEALKETGRELLKEGKASVDAGINRIKNPLFSSDQFSGPRERAKLPGQTDKPLTAAGAKTDESEAIKKALEDYEKAGRRIEAMNVAFGESFDSVSAEIDRMTKLFETLSENGVDPASVGLSNLAKDLKFLQDSTGPVSVALLDLAVKTRTGLAAMSEQGATSSQKLAFELAQVQQAIDKISMTPNMAGAQEALKMLTDQANELSVALKEATPSDEFTQALQTMGDTIRSGLFQASLEGADALAKLKVRQDAMAKALDVGRQKGQQQSSAFKQLAKDYKDVTAAIEEQTTAMMFQAAAADFLAEAVGMALQGGIHEGAKQKAKQTGIEALEWLVRGTAYAIFGSPLAGPAFKNAAAFGAISVAWAALAGASSGGGSNAGAGASNVSVPSSSASSGGENISSARDTSADATRNVQPPAPEVSIYLTGPGFDMLNPQLQRVVRGASQEAAERYGNAKVRVVPHGA